MRDHWNSTGLKGLGGLSKCIGNSSSAARSTQDADVTKKHIPSPILQLPSELLLHIATFLDPEFQVLFSLTSKRFHFLLTTCMDLSLRHGSPNKLRFLQHLEFDFPEFQICSICGILYKWQHREKEMFSCPRFAKHTYEEQWNSYGSILQGSHGILLNPETINLVFRAHQRGQKYGLPLSFLNTAQANWRGIACSNEARFINGQLLIASRWEGTTNSLEDLSWKLQLLPFGMCRHWRTVLGKTRAQGTDHALAILLTETKEHPFLKCRLCATDCEIYTRARAGCEMTIVMHVWRNYGAGWWTPLDRQMFNWDRAVEVEPDVLSQRDLRGMFNSGEDDDDDATSVCDTLQSFALDRDVSRFKVYR